MHKHKNIAGFTLVEMMVVVALLAIMASIAMPSFARLIAANNVEAAGNELYGLLQYARAEAVARGQRVTVSAGSSDAWAQALVVSTINGGAAVTLRSYESLNQPKVSAEASTQALSDLAFYSNGSSSGSTLITLCYSPDITITGKVISVARSGQVSAPQSAVCQ